MITAVKSTALSICGTMIITGIFMMLFPSASQNRTVKLAVSLFFLLSLAAPFGKKAEWHEPFRWEEQNSSFSGMADLEQSLLHEFSRRLEEQALTVLREEKIEPLDISFAMHIDEENRISITGLDLRLRESDAGRSAEAIRRLNELFGLTVTLALEKDREG